MSRVYFDFQTKITLLQRQPLPVTKHSGVQGSRGSFSRVLLCWAVFAVLPVGLALVFV